MCTFIDFKYNGTECSLPKEVDACEFASCLCGEFYDHLALKWNAHLGEYHATVLFKPFPPRFPAMHTNHVAFEVRSPLAPECAFLTLEALLLLVHEQVYVEYLFQSGLEAAHGARVKFFHVQLPVRIQFRYGSELVPAFIASEIS